MLAVLSGDKLPAPVGAGSLRERGVLLWEQEQSREQQGVSWSRPAEIKETKDGVAQSCRGHALAGTMQVTGTKPKE